ncbi:MAG TPA: Ig-like domain-containing protein [Gammaproteobacteria bacterium]|nr:Ig-like domain-containing protein [Gammaproteobacteria bacterium]
MRSSKFTRRVLGLPGLLAALFLVGCGSESTIVGPPGGGTPDSPVASITLIASSNVLPSGGAAVVTFSVLVRDANNNAVTGVPVTYSADSGLLQVIPDPDGVALPAAELSTGGDPTNRPITVTATTGSLSSSVTVNVTGTVLTLEGPDNVIQGDEVPFTARLQNSAGQGIAGRTVTIESAAGNTLSADSLTTNSQGQVSFTVTGTQGGADTISVSALGLTATAPLSVSADDSVVFLEPAAGTEIPLNVAQPVTVEWRVNNVPQAGQTINFSTTRGSLSALSAVLDAAGQATVNLSATTAGPATLTARVGAAGPQTQRSIEFVALTPASIVVQASRFTVGPGEQSTIVATVRDAANNPVKNKVVQFQIEDVTGGSLSVGTAITGSAGTAQTVYTGGETISGSGDVTITAIVQENPALTATLGLTVARRQVDISIGTGNELFEPNTAQYEREFLVQVTDSQGVGVADAAVQLSVRSKLYRKGFYVEGANDRWVVGPGAILCPDEDLNNNGQLNANEDFNGSGSIEAGNVVSVTPGDVVTDESGTAIFRIRYAQEFGNWVIVTITARAAVQGTEFEDRSDHALEITAADANVNQSPPGGLISRFGGGDLDPNPDPTDEGLTVPEYATRLAELGFAGGRPLGCRTED